MWHSSAHQDNHHGGGNGCFDPGRGRGGDWNRDPGHGQHHGENGWGDPGCHDGGGWGDPGWHGGGGWGGGDCNDRGGWGGGECHDRGGWGGGECHDGGRGLISFDHNSFLVCH